MRLWHLKWIDQTFVKISISIIALFLSWIIGSISISIPWVILKCWYIAIKFQPHIDLGFNVFFLPSFTAIPAVYYIFQVSLLFYWALLGFTGFYWVSKVFFTEFYCDSGGLSRFSGFTIVLLGFYWVLTIFWLLGTLFFLSGKEEDEIVLQPSSASVGPVKT